MTDLDKFIGIPYRKNGRKMNGCDCFGIIYLIWKENGLSDVLEAYVSRKDTEGWKEFVARQITSSQEQGVLKSIPVGELLPLDILVFKMPARVIHFGVYAGEDKFIHSIETARHSIKDRLSVPEFWKKRFITGLRKVT